MRYFYYGSERDSENRNMENARRGRTGSRYGRNGRQADSGSSLVIEDDTIYEIDEGCEECRRRQNRQDV